VEDILGQNLLFSIDEEEAERFLARHASEFGRRYGWPGFWTGSMDDARSHLADTGARGFVLSSSSGLNGWVLAREMRFVDDDGGS
jgi:hypothetical protein